MAAPIVKGPETLRYAPNLASYDAARREFSWETARRELAGLPGGRGLNIAYEAVDRHLSGPLADKLALRWLGRRDEVRDFSFAELARRTNRRDVFG